MFWVGTSGYNYPEWKGSFYPDDLPAKKMLPYYAARFPTVEINYTFYRMPTEKLVAGWAEQTPAPYKLTLKAPRRITHDKRLQDVGDDVKFFCDVAGTLGEKLGTLLFQLPPFLRKDLAVLDTFLGELPPDVRAAFEFRHASWFDEDVFDAAGRAQPGRVHRRQREALHARAGDRRLRVFPPARRRLPARRHQAMGRDDRARRGSAAATCSCTSSTKSPGRGPSSRAC